MTLKRYALFAGAAYYPGGGMKDLQGFFDTAEEAGYKTDTENWDWWQIVDTTTWEIVRTGH